MQLLESGAVVSPVAEYGHHIHIAISIVKTESPVSPAGLACEAEVESVIKRQAVIVDIGVERHVGAPVGDYGRLPYLYR